MKPSITEAEFEFLARRAGLEMSEKQKSELYAAYPYIEAMIARVHQKRGREAEPAHIFTFAKEVAR
jgi:hypothetical protein